MSEKLNLTYVERRKVELAVKALQEVYNSMGQEAKRQSLDGIIARLEQWQR